MESNLPKISYIFQLRRICAMVKGFICLNKFSINYLNKEMFMWTWVSVQLCVSAYAIQWNSSYRSRPGAGVQVY